MGEDAVSRARRLRQDMKKASSTLMDYDAELARQRDENRERRRLEREALLDAEEKRTRSSILQRAASDGAASKRASVAGGRTQLDEGQLKRLEDESVQRIRRRAAVLDKERLVLEQELRSGYVLGRKLEGIIRTKVHALVPHAARGTWNAKHSSGAERIHCTAYEMLGHLRRKASVIGSSWFGSNNPHLNEPALEDEFICTTQPSAAATSNAMSSAVSSYFRAAVHMLADATTSASSAASSYADSASTYIEQQYARPKKYVLQSPDFYG
ncbi:hypothetical protein SeMB42_g01068 [Synchytrium endobioticum]|nr:hypothetical protein SeMB42_g01068 [Synchytrium endobioticum]